MDATTSQFTCPSCGDHPVTVESDGFAATTATVTGCPKFAPAVAIEVRASEPSNWRPWNEPATVRVGGGLVEFTSVELDTEWNCPVCGDTAEWCPQMR